jgi:agmatinase
MPKKEIAEKFNPNGPGIKGSLFGLPFTPDTAEIVIIPIPWEVTVSYHSGTAKGPEAVLKASLQVDHGNKDIDEPWKPGIAMLPVSQKIYNESSRLRSLVQKQLKHFENEKHDSTETLILDKINEGCEILNIYVKSIAKRLLKKGKLVGVLGGDHSSPLGLLRALNDQYDQFGILQIDAHADLRRSYEGFTYSHASVMYNALRLPSIEKLVQVGVRDYCDEELNVIERARGRVVTFFDDDLKSNRYAGITWDSICNQIIRELPQHVYISFDIDGLDPKLCPHTGTPVAGGLEFTEAVYLIKKIVASGRIIIGFDLNEVAPGTDDWDANVGARLLYQLCTWMAVSAKKLTVKNWEAVLNPS